MNFWPESRESKMPGGWDSYAQAVYADGPVAWYRFSELLAGSAVSAGSQDPQNICFDSGSGSPGNLNSPVNLHQNSLQYGSAVLSNQPSLLSTHGSSAVSSSGNAGGSALFPSTATTSTTNIITGGAAQPAILQPTAAITVAAWHKPGVIVGNAKQVLAAYGTDASSLAAYCLFHTGTTSANHVFEFAINIGGALKTAVAAAPALVVGTVYYAVGTYDGVNVRIYVNGVLQGTTAATGAISYASIGSFGLAMGNDGSTSDGNIQGSLDEVGIYSYALSATRIAYHFRQGANYLPFVWNH
jgi:Concanavalin A-like lectin/glucanases superfamily